MDYGKLKQEIENQLRLQKLQVIDMFLVKIIQLLETQLVINLTCSVLIFLIFLRHLIKRKRKEELLFYRCHTNYQLHQIHILYFLGSPWRHDRGFDLHW